MQPQQPSATPLCGVFLYPLLAILTLLSSCEEHPKTPTWKETSPSSDTLITDVIEPSDKKTTPSKKITPFKSGKTVRFMAYNLKNYLTMSRHNPETKKRSMLPKPNKEIKALIKIITDSKPDILGICEIGTKKDLIDLQQKLHSSGLNLPHTHFTSGSDPYRRLAILSKFPITPHPSPNLEYRMRGETHLVNRGILDVSIKLHSTEVRFLGVHLKSKRKVEKFDEAIIRRNEANVLRSHITKILKASDSPLLVYGDFNDTKRSAPIRAIKGPNSGSLSLYYIDAKAPDGSKWTHHWDYEDLYSRFDYVFVSPSLRKMISFKTSCIIAPPPYDPASDHRPIVVEIND